MKLKNRIARKRQMDHFKWKMSVKKQHTRIISLFETRISKKKWKKIKDSKPPGLQCPYWELEKWADQLPSVNQYFRQKIRRTFIDHKEYRMKSYG